MNKKIRRIVGARKRRIARRLKARGFKTATRPMLSSGRPRYEISGRASATAYGGLGAIQALACRLHLPQAINSAIPLFKRRAPYFESDHVLAIAYSHLCGFERLEDLEFMRRDEALLNLLGASRLPDPTTAGDFLRRFKKSDVLALMDAFNSVRRKVWRQLPDAERQTAYIDVDGSILGTYGEKKGGMGMSYKGVWGYHPLLVSLANTREPLYVVQRPGNVPSHCEAHEWIDKAIALCAGSFDQIVVRGDTDFALTAHFDGWSQRGVSFVFGYDARPNVVALADALGESAFTPLKRPAPPPCEHPRAKRINTKEQIVREKGYRSIRLEEEHVAEIEYQPGKCKRPYRLIVLRKRLRIHQGGELLIPEIRYFFYITNTPDLSAAQIVKEANTRCEQENLIDQFKHGFHAMSAPAHDLNSNWAHMAIVALAWSLKAWLGISLKESDRKAIIKMEFKRFHHELIAIAAQIIRGARRTTIRLLQYTQFGVAWLFASLETRQSG